jgi:allantoin racemase
MSVILINPNSTGAMTASALAAARRAAPEIAFEGWTSEAGPPAIEGPEDGDAAVPPLLDLVGLASRQGAGAIIIACFDDTGLEDARRIADCPVLGIGQASYTLAALLSGETAVITTVKVAVPVIRTNIETGGFGGTVKHVIAANVPVLTLEHDPEAAFHGFRAATERLPDGIENVILGCAGAVSITGRLAHETRFRVIDGVSAAARLSRAILP